ncbi:MAG: CpaF family protein [Lachnospiraceae bacterium]|nr:CpaF family protein [Lachnospiraceae bacterium]
MIEKVRQEVLNRLDQTRELSDEEIWECIDEVIIWYSKREYLPLSRRSQVRKGVFDSLRRLDVLQDLLERDEITEIMVNGCDDIFIEQNGSIKKLDRHFVSSERLSDVIQLMVAKVNRRVNEASPIVDSRLEDGSRVNVVLNPIAINGPIVTIRKFPKTPVTMEMLLAWEAISREAADMLKDMVFAGYNIIVCGGTGSGKTTFLNAMSDFIPKEERIITIEDSAELQIRGVPNLVRMETRNATAEGEHSITIRDLIRASLRMRPDRIIVGEVRGEEAVDLLQSMNTGHDGAMSSGHSNSPMDMLRRLETMVLMGMDMPIQAIRGQIASAVDILVHLGRLRDRSRRVLEISEVLPLKDEMYQLNPLFWFEELSQEEGRIIGHLSGSKERLQNRQKLVMAGIDWKLP